MIIMIENWAEKEGFKKETATVLDRFFMLFTGKIKIDEMPKNEVERWKEIGYLEVDKKDGRLKPALTKEEIKGEGVS